jgi:hypothetical protein
MGLLKHCSRAALVVLVVNLSCGPSATVATTGSSSSQANPGTTFEPSVNADVTTIPFCDLVRDPASYDKKIVRMNAVLSTGFEVSRLDSPSCPNTLSVWAEFGVDSCTRPKLNKTLDRLLRREGRAEIMIIGQFFAPRIDQETGPRGYGHMNGYDSKLNVMCIETAKSIKQPVTK